jgi:protein involved in polysaccharide export with SLBB domain
VDRLKKLSMAGVLACVSLLTGCFSSNPEDIQDFDKPYEINVTADRYIVQPPDELELRCAQVPEVNLQRQRIRPDGKISFEILGEFPVAGKTPAEIGQIVGKRVNELYTLGADNAVDVRIVVFASQVYYVLGMVNRPGPRGFTGRNSVLTAIADAQPNTMAWEKRVQVVRPLAEEGGDPFIFEVNYDRMVIHGDTSKDVLLREGDIIYVPPTPLAAIGMVLEEFLSPIARAFYGAYLIQNPPTTTGAYSPYGGAGIYR